MDLDRDPVADLEFVHRGPELDDRAHIFVADRKVLVEWQFAFDHRWQAVPQYLDIGGADRNRVDADQHLCPARFRHRLFDQRQFLGPAENPGFHRAWHRVFIPAVRCSAIAHRCHFNTSAAPAAPLLKRKEILAAADAARYCSSHTSARSCPMKWLGVMCQPFSLLDVTTIRFHHKIGTV